MQKAAWCSKSEIVFKGMNDLTADGIKSYEGFSDAWIEEAQNFSLNSFQKENTFFAVLSNLSA